MYVFVLVRHQIRLVLSTTVSLKEIHIDIFHCLIVKPVIECRALWEVAVEFAAAVGRLHSMFCCQDQKLFYPLDIDICCKKKKGDFSP